MPFHRRTCAQVAGSLFLLFTPSVCNAEDWIRVVRSCVDGKDFGCARAAVQQRLLHNPNDAEALAWRARLTAWSGDFVSARAQYSAALLLAPNDSDILLGLADVQLWSGDAQSALTTLEKAEAAYAAAAEVLLRRAKVLVALHRPRDAAACYQQLLETDPSSSEARRRVSELAAERNPVHQLRLGVDISSFNYTGPAAMQTAELTSNWSSRWSTHLGGTFQERFGEHAQIGSAGATYHLQDKDWVTVVGGVGSRQEVAPQYELGLDYGHAFTLRRGTVRGVEIYLQQRRLWFADSAVATFGSTTIVYLPRDWTITVSTTAVRTDFDNSGTAWAPSGFARIEFPLQRRLRANVLYGVGAENFARADELGHFAARSFGGGIRYSINRRRDFSGFVLVQHRWEERSQVNVGATYAIRF